MQHILQPIPFEQGEPEFKEKFVERYSKLTDWATFKKYSLSYLNRSLRVNTLKISVEDLKKRLVAQGWVLQQIPWYPEGFWVEHVEGRRDLGNTLEHQLGYFYIQEAASMIPAIALDPQPGEIILDMCAAPGSKTTQVAQHMKNQGLVIANDVTGIRLAPLGVNVQRLGISSIVQMQYDGLKMRTPFFQFDRILLDAPCTGVGTIRKSLKTIGAWNPNFVLHMRNIQKRLLFNAYGMVKPGGVIVYSTCSTEPEEDEEVLTLLLEKYPDAKIESFDLPGFIRSPAVTEFQGKMYDPQVKHSLRVWPQDNDTEGFFVAKIRKPL